MRVFTISICLFILGTSILPAQTDSLPSPWQEIKLTGKQMKPGFGVKQNKAFPWIPVGSALIGGGVITYFLVQGDDDNPPEECSHQATFLNSPSTCESEDGAIMTRVTPPGNYTYEWSNGSTSPNLSMLAADMYLVTITDANDCSQVFTTFVIENTTITTTDDSYTLTCNESLSGNLLENDEGNNISISTNTSPDNGMLTLEPNGDFTYVPMPGDTGQVTFNYTIIDPCNNTDMGQVSIQINSGVCDFTASFNSTEADCGLENGQLEVVIDPPGNYTYTWNNGETSTRLTSLIAGEYEVTVSDQQSCCSLVFTTTLTEKSADYFSNVMVTQPQCSTDGEIQFNFSSPGTGPWTMQVTYPPGIEVYSINPSTILLSSYVPIIPGDYTILLRDESTGTGCSDSLTVTILPAEMLMVALEGVQQPSSPSANDGVITITITTPTVEPYSVTINGDIFGDFPGPTISIPGLPVGQYNIQLTDPMGCQSNVLTVELMAFTGVQFGTGISMLPSPLQEREKSGVADLPVLPGTLIYANYTNTLGGFDHNWQLGLILPNRVLPNQAAPPPTLRLEQMTTLYQTQFNGLILSSRIGGLAHVNQNQAQTQWSLEGKMNWSFFSKIKLEIRAGIRGKEHVDSPYLEGVMVGQF